MRFSGSLQTQGDPEGWLKTTLNLVGGRVEIVAGEETLGTWSVSQVKAERIAGNRFDLSLGEDRAVFLADDALAFSYEALPQLAKNPIVEAAQGFRQKLLGSARKAAKVVEVVAPEPPTPSAPSPADNIVWQEPPAEAPANVKRLRELIEAARANREETDDEPEESGESAERVPEVAVLSIDPPMRLMDSDAEPDPGPLWAGSELGRRINPPAADDSDFFTSPLRPEEVEPPAREFQLTPVKSLREPNEVEALPAEEPFLALVDTSQTDELVSELEQLLKWVSTNDLKDAQAQAAANLVRSIRALLDS
ncbi:MAG TPA: hypothetical protein VJQ57_05880 [Acidimicrobiia bacterium]|nr:hypothetical protein [Acidimicrobiia bacterium]